jgi:hypothetical protein
LKYCLVLGSGAFSEGRQGDEDLADAMDGPTSAGQVSVEEVEVEVEVAVS